MDEIIRGSTKVNLDGFNLQKENNRLFLFNGNEQIGPLDENIDATKVCKDIVTSKKYLNNKR